MIRLRGVTKRYEGAARPALDGVDLHVREGELVALVGGSGSGKTTALRIINRLIDGYSGVVEVGGVDVQREDPVLLRRRIGYVIQGVGLFPHMTVGQNVGTVPRLLGWAAADIAERTDELLETLGMPPSEYRDRMPAELSGGQRQRVGVARALAARQKVLLMDEPFGALDAITRDALQQEIVTLRERLGLTVVLVTHDMAEALILGDRIAVLNEGRVEQFATPRELMSKPASPYVEGLISTPKRQADQLEAIADGAGP